MKRRIVAMSSASQFSSTSSPATAPFGSHVAAAAAAQIQPHRTRSLLPEGMNDLSTTTSAMHGLPFSTTTTTTVPLVAVAPVPTSHCTSFVTANPHHQTKRFRDDDEDDDEGEYYEDEPIHTTTTFDEYTTPITTTMDGSPDFHSKKQRSRHYQPPRTVPLSVVSVMGSLVGGMRRQLSGSQLDQFLVNTAADDDHDIMMQDDDDHVRQHRINMERRMSF